MSRSRAAPLPPCTRGRTPCAHPPRLHPGSPSYNLVLALPSKSDNLKFWYNQLLKNNYKNTIFMFYKNREKSTEMIKILVNLRLGI
jgi:hypothetical protein